MVLLLVHHLANEGIARPIALHVFTIGQAKRLHFYTGLEGHEPKRQHFYTGLEGHEAKRPHLYNANRLQTLSVTQSVVQKAAFLHGSGRPWSQKAATLEHANLVQLFIKMI